ncbi:MAG: hypothetical protein ABIQ12_03030 [Opitutaceae bacterium]
METDVPVVAKGVPEALWAFLRGSCHLAFDSFRALPGDRLPEPAHGLLDHASDMTSTLAVFHGSPLRVDVLQCRRVGELYLREVFLRTIVADRIVEYGVIAVALDQYSTEQRAAIESGEAPLGALLHRFQIPFVSAPIGFFSATAANLSGTPLAEYAPGECYGRLNCLSKPTREPLAWIVEILPPA